MRSTGFRVQHTGQSEMVEDEAVRTGSRELWVGVWYSTAIDEEGLGAMHQRGRGSARLVLALASA